ncbi:Dabb family protein [Nonomuraea typhae]|uniref:Dabb family protein n=1 Tax=Nonomuraea typhae TaxID=2603600 RepID=UPI0012F9A5DD|nr:Dabb family protein [Nonomuraea typhae]
MIRHIALMTWSEEATDEQKAAVAEGLAALPAVIPQLRRFNLGTDLGLAPGTSDFAVVAEFDSVADYEVYRDHPAHQAVLAERIKPILAGRAAVQVTL